MDVERSKRGDQHTKKPAANCRVTSRLLMLSGVGRTPSGHRPVAATNNVECVLEASCMVPSLYCTLDKIQPSIIVRLQLQLTESQAARPAGLSRVNGVHRIVVLKHDTSTLCQSHNFISIDLTFGVDDNVRKDTSPAKLGSDPMSGRDATWGNVYGSCDFSFCLFFIQKSYSPYPWTNFRAK